ncbi:MAG TPA: CDP-alcohol phosphatidyltransferase family protein [Polyangiaceae bacterium]|nr:CDP-alcohol phosphatidyltransferase family protein [Polyangiaceae bacterium]
MLALPGKMAETPADGPKQPKFVLRLDPADGQDRRLGGLPLGLRLALDAQAAGASAVVVPEAASELRALLDDPRLRLPIVTTAPHGAGVLAAPASLLAHRGTLKELGQRLVPGAIQNVTDVREPPSVAYSFAPIDVSSSDVASQAERALFRSLRKPQDGWTSRHLNRYISLSISRWLVKTPLRPNQVSVGILGVGVLGALLAARGGYANLALGAALFQAQSVLDGCDGEMSRVSHRGSKMGEWLDTIGDDLTNYGFFGGAGLGLYRQTGQQLYLIAGIVCVACGVLASGLEYRYLIKIGSGDLLKYPLSQASSGEGKLAFLAPLFKRDTFVFLTLLAALGGALGPMLCVFSLGAIGILFSVLKTELRLAREARAATG